LAHTDEEIVSKAIRDYMIIKDLNAFKGDSRVGIEGMVLKDYKDNVAKIVDLTAKINSLSEKSDENKEIIKELSDERKIYKDNVNALLSGEKAEEYFKKSVFYLSKVVSEP
jgi:putative N-acetylmannosamine-6-phosphate epimerase